MSLISAIVKAQKARTEAAAAANPDLISAASNAGKLAYAAGIKAAAQDPAMIAIINDASKVVAVLAVLKAWNKAWHDTHLAATAAALDT
jgi:hypothetical protein